MQPGIMPKKPTDMTNPFRKEYRKLDEREQRLIKDIKDQAGRLYDAMAIPPKTRETHLAITKLEEAVMWAVKAITG